MNATGENRLETINKPSMVFFNLVIAYSFTKASLSLFLSLSLSLSLESTCLKKNLE
jgi:hypothetical protein